MTINRAAARKEMSVPSSMSFAFLFPPRTIPGGVLAFEQSREPFPLRRVQAVNRRCQRRQRVIFRNSARETFAGL